jgi:hypothetical protein
MIKIKFHAPWLDDEKTKKWISKYANENDEWDRIKLCNDENYDFLVIFNHPNPKLIFDAKRTILFQGEPEPIRRGWGTYYKPDPLKFFCLWDTPRYFNSVGWSFEHSVRDFRSLNIEKTKLMSGVIKDKSDALFPYAYTFNAENVQEKNYFTEKITDAIMAECLCFYWGCPNISNFSQAFVWIDLNDQKAAFDTIIHCIEKKEREKRLPYIRAAKKKIMDEYQPMALVNKILKEKNVI